MKIKLGLIVISIFLMAVWAGPAFAEGQGTCNTGYSDKIDGAGPHVVSAPGDMVFTQVVVKAGSEQSVGDSPCSSFTTDSSNDCYSVSGIGTGTVEVSKTGSGPSCKDISHIEVFWGSIDDGSKPPDDPENPVTGPDPDPVDPGIEIITPPTPPVTATDTSALNPSNVTTAAPAGTSAVTVAASGLPSTGIGLLAPLAGLGMAAAGLWLGKRRS